MHIGPVVEGARLTAGLAEDAERTRNQYEVFRVLFFRGFRVFRCESC